MAWLLLALATAFFESLKDFFAKRNVNQKRDLYLVAWSTHVFALPVLFFAVRHQAWPHLDLIFLKAVVVSASLNVVSALLMVHAFEASELSLSIPMLALSPMFMLITSPLMLGEVPHASGLLGVLLMAAGAYMLNLDQRRNGWLSPFKALIHHKGPRYMLGVALIWSVCANIDKIGVRHSSPWHWILGYEIAMAVLLSILLAPRLWRARGELVGHWRQLLPIGFCGAAAMLFQMQAITLTLVTYVVAVKRLSAFFSVLWGAVFLKEGSIRQRMVGVLVMLLGVFVLAWTSLG